VTAEEFVGVDADFGVIAKQGAPDRDSLIPIVAMGKSSKLRAGWKGDWIPDRGKGDDTALEAELPGAGGLGALERTYWHDCHLSKGERQVDETEVLHPGAFWKAGMLDS
jgi:hypothetical protein